MKPRYFVAWSPVAVAYAVFDRNKIRTENSTGYGIIWGTDNPDKSLVEADCAEMNEDYERECNVGGDHGSIYGEPVIGRSK